MSNIKVKSISVIGLGKLGASMVASFAHRGFNVIGVDNNPKAVNSVKRGKAPVQETNLQEFITANSKRIRATKSYSAAICETDITFVVVPTPSNRNGSFNLKFAAEAFLNIGKALKIKKKYHVLVMTSTVLPGTTRGLLLDIVEKESGLKRGIDFGICYNPEFIALGTVIRDFLNPDFYLLGSLDERSANYLEFVHRKVSENNAPIKRMSIENAELAKIALNSYVTLKISFANMLADFCEKIPYGRVDIVSDALGMDKRIGRKYLSGGLGFAGPCFPRDNIALSYLAKSLKIDSSLLDTNHKFNSKISSKLISKIKKTVPSESRITILGLAYKPNSHVIEASPGMAISKGLNDLGFKVKAHDNLAFLEAKKTFGNQVAVTKSLKIALKELDVLIIATPDNLYKSLSPEDLNIDKDRKLYIFDCWRCVSHLSNYKNIIYFAIGNNINEKEAERNLFSLWTKKHI